MARPSISPVGALLLAVIAGAGLWLGGRGTIEGESDAQAATLIDGAGAGITALSVKMLDGTVLPIARAGNGAPTVVMVGSETCTYCKAALREMGRVAAGRPLARLRVVTLEGAAAGIPMVEGAHVTGATLAGPVTPAAEALFAFQIRGTPTFLALDDRGQVTGSLVGYPGADELRPWIDVMLGERDRPSPRE